MYSSVPQVPYLSMLLDRQAILFCLKLAPSSDPFLLKPLSSLEFNAHVQDRSGALWIYRVNKILIPLAK